MTLSVDNGLNSCQWSVSSGVNIGILLRYFIFGDAAEPRFYSIISLWGFFSRRSRAASSLI